jgi:hypothetical protein
VADKDGSATDRPEHVWSFENSAGFSDAEPAALRVAREAA